MSTGAVSAASHADVAISRLTFDERELTQFNAVLDGTTTEHAFKVDALASRTNLHLAGKGSFKNGEWNATIADLLIDDAANIKLRLDAPVALMASAKAFRLDALCLHGKVARLCGEGGLERSRLERARRGAQPAHQHAHRRIDPARRIPGHHQCHRKPARQPWHAAGR